MLHRRVAAACILAALAPASTALAAAERSAPPPVAPTPATIFSSDEIIVEWAMAASHADRVDAREDAEVEFKSDLGNRSFQLVETDTGQTAGEAVRKLNEDPAVAIAERDGAVAVNSAPDDPLFDRLWGVRNAGLGIDGFSGALAGADIGAAAAWDRTVGTSATVIADIDSGYRFEHPDLANVAWTNSVEAGGSSGVDDDGNGIIDDIHGADFIGANGEAPTIDGDPTDDDLLSGGHGVHTAGTIGAEGNNGVGITGVAQDVRIMPLRACSRYPANGDNRCRISSILAAINYAKEEGARVVNMSLGGNQAFQTEVDAIAAADETLFVISAGNDSSDNDGSGAAPHGHRYPCDFNPQIQAPSVPGAIDNIVCVAATNQADGLAGFSNWGATSVDLGAPGTETLSTYPYATPFSDTFAVDDFSAKWPATGSNGGFERTNESPLTSFGMTDAIGPLTADTVHETTSASITLPVNGGCKLFQRRRIVLKSGGHYRYSVLLDGVEQPATVKEPASTSKPGLEKRFIDLPVAFDAGGSVQIRFRFTTGSAPSPDEGVWLDDVSIVCAETVGQASSYAYLQGTSMAAPHVSGAAGLLFSLKPSATITEVKNALLSSVDPDPALSGKTTSGGRLNVVGAMQALMPAAGEPETEITSGPSGPTYGGETVFQFHRSDSMAAATFECRLVAETSWSSCASPQAYDVDLGAHLFQARAKSGLQVDPIPAAQAWTVIQPPSLVVMPPPEPIPTPPPTGLSGAGAVRKVKCTVPRLAGRTLGQAQAALTRAGCKLGAVTKPKAKKGNKPGVLVVKSSTPGPGVKPASGRVDLKLGPRPKRKKPHHPQHHR